MISDGAELALLDVREEGEFGVAHMLYAIPLPYSVLEMRLGQWVPRRTTRTVLVDAGDGVGERAAKRHGRAGLQRRRVLEGGMPAMRVPPAMRSSWASTALQGIRRSGRACGPYAVDLAGRTARHAIGR